VICPLLANVYLHEVLDVWFARHVQPRLRGRAELIRYADDFVVVCEREDDARRWLDVLPKRFGRYGLRLHPDKTRLARFMRPSGGDGDRSETFDFLGFTHYWGVSRKKRPIVKRQTVRSGSVGRCGESGSGVGLTATTRCRSSSLRWRRSSAGTSTTSGSPATHGR
jgi:hypothetical protein